MQRMRAKHPALVLCFMAMLVSGCRSDDSFCPVPGIEADPETIPAGDNQTSVTVVVRNPRPDNGRPVRSELYADSGTFADPFAAETRYSCAHDIVGEVELCVDARYGEPGAPGSGGTGGNNGLAQTFGAAVEYLRAPTAYFPNPDACLETACTTITCPAEKNACPVISELSVTPEVVGEGQSATVRVTASDPDENPAPLVTTLQASHGAFGDRFASETAYTCDPAVGGTIEICVLASDGDDACDVSQCVTVQCPGPAPDNDCPVIRDLTANPTEIPIDERQSLITVDAFDPDAVNPEPLRTTLSASAGTFENRDAPTTLFTCGAPGPAEICVEASDGDRGCDKERCITVQCPSTVEDNFCPKLYVLNAIPSTIPPGQSSTEVQVRADDDDGGPLPMVTTLYSLRGTFDNPNARDTIYRCERSGLNEVCVDATDGACVKTLCMDVICPEL